MIRVSVLYPYAEEAFFDMEYYRTKHMPLVRNKLEPLSVEIDVGVTDKFGNPPTFLAIGYLVFESLDELADRYLPASSDLLADIPHFTDVEPVIQVSEMTVHETDGPSVETETMAFARKWIDDWNSHDLERIMSHYADDLELTSPMINVALGIDEGALKGKKRVREYWVAALKKVPDLHFELVDATSSVDSIAIYYKSVLGRMAIEVMFRNGEGKVERVIAHYTD